MKIRQEVLSIVDRLQKNGEEIDDLKFAEFRLGVDDGGFEIGDLEKGRSPLSYSGRTAQEVVEKVEVVFVRC